MINMNGKFGIIYYRNNKGDKIPVGFGDDVKELLDADERERIRYMYSYDDKAGEYKKTGKKGKTLDRFKQKTLYLWVEGTEFLVKND